MSLLLLLLVFWKLINLLRPQYWGPSRARWRNKKETLMSELWEGGDQYKRGRHLASCWNLLPPTGNYRAVSLPVTTAVPGLPVDRLWFNTQIPPTPMLVRRPGFCIKPYLEEWGFIIPAEDEEETWNSVSLKDWTFITWEFQCRLLKDNANC